jgi:hypothetical protein
LEEIITLSGVSLVVTEFLPFGANALAQVISFLGFAERKPGGYISNTTDTLPGTTRFTSGTALTRVDPLDWAAARHANFEADIATPVPPGVVQVETLGISLSAGGIAFYGMQVEAVGTKARDHISLDSLA